jgi:protein-tyrosine phosphatase
MARAFFDSALVICTGNICRSPMGEVLLRERLDAAGMRTRVESAGIGAVVGAGAHDHAKEVMAAWGHDLSGHVARQLEASMGADFELLLVMETGQKQWIERRFPQLAGRTYRLGHWLDEEIDDPMGRSVETFRQSRDHIDHAIGSWLERFGIGAAGGASSRGP